ncbi:MAG: 4-hydroxythreonine-4-phosphate dehydrogenase PdxA [Armatimonadota bacterium]
MESERPLVAITMGDPNGVGPEIAVAAACRPEVKKAARCVLVGRSVDAEAAARVLGISASFFEMHPGAEWKEAEKAVCLLPVDESVGAWPPVYGAVTAEAGKAALASVEKAVYLALSGKADAVVTAPLCKESIHLAGCRYPGHTELLANLSGAGEVRMMLVLEGLRVVHNSSHVALRTACDMVKADRVLTTIRMAYGAALDMDAVPMVIGVAGLNPHAGEGGLFGSEEAEIAKAVETARSEGMDCRGPIPADTLFARALAGEFGVVVAMYHDQGHIPVKTLGFKTAAVESGRAFERRFLVRGVNVTLGLPFIRTSVDHGTAFDIAGQGIADCGSMVDAILLAAEMAGRRLERRRSAS